MDRGLVMSISKSEIISDVRRTVETYLHQDWTIEGSTLEEVFENNEGLEGIAEEVKSGSQYLIDSNLSNHELDRIIMIEWGAGYEPEVEGFDDWRAALREIVRLCDKHLDVMK